MRRCLRFWVSFLLGTAKLAQAGGPARLAWPGWRGWPSAVGLARLAGLAAQVRAFVGLWMSGRNGGPGSWAAMLHHPARPGFAHGLVPGGVGWGGADGNVGLPGFLHSGKF